MAYSDYGAFTCRNGERRPDKEDVGVYDTDEASVPTAFRIFANIMKNRERGTSEWWQHSQHGVMGDGPVRVACYKQGVPCAYYWAEGSAEPVAHGLQGLSDTPPLPEPEASADKEAWNAYYASCWTYDYGSVEIAHDFGTGEYRFTLTDSQTSDSGHYEATMTEPDGTRWTCVYDYGYGAGLTSYDG